MRTVFSCCCGAATMTMSWTIGWLAVSTILAGLGIWQDRRPLGLAPPPLVPAMVWLAIGTVGIVLGLAHLLTLLTGVELHGRGAF